MINDAQRCIERGIRWTEEQSEHPNDLSIFDENEALVYSSEKAEDEGLPLDGPCYVWVDISLPVICEIIKFYEREEARFEGAIFVGLRQIVENVYHAHKNPMTGKIDDSEGADSWVNELRRAADWLEDKMAHKKDAAHDKAH